MKLVLITIVLLVITQATIAQLKPIKKDNLSNAIKLKKTLDSCNCGDKFNNLPERFEIKMNYPAASDWNATNSICLKQLCISPLFYEAPDMGMNDCISYEWYIHSQKMPTAQDPLNYYRCISMTGQGTSKISINYNDIKEMRVHTGSIQIKCNGKVKLGNFKPFAVKDCPINN